MNYKHYITSAAIVISAIAVQAQEATISGRIKDIGNAEFVLYYMDGATQKSDTIQIKNDLFSWKGVLREPQKVGFMFPSRYAEAFLEAGTIKIDAHKDSLYNLRVTGSKLQDEADAYAATLVDLEERTNPLYEKWGKGTAEEQLKIEQEMESIRKERRQRAAKYIAAHPKSAFSLSLVEDRSTMGSFEEVKPLYDLLDKGLLNTAKGKALTDRLAVIQRSALGSDMLAFTQNDQHGNPVSFADFKGKFVLVDFWASWCGPCRAENPNVLKAYNTYKDKNFTVLGISLDDNAEKWNKAIKDDAMPWTQVSSLKGFDNEVSTYYGIRGIPSTLLVDPTGKIIAKDLRGEFLQQKLAEIFE